MFTQSMLALLAVAAVGCGGGSTPPATFDAPTTTIDARPSAIDAHPGAIDARVIDARPPADADPLAPDANLTIADAHVATPDAHVNLFDAQPGAPDAHVNIFDAHVNTFDAHVGSIDAHVNTFDAHVGTPDAHVAGTPDAHVAGAPDAQVAGTPDAHVAAFDAHVPDARIIFDAHPPADANPHLTDSDGDGFNDFDEINDYGTDPNDPASFPTMHVALSVDSTPTDVCSNSQFSAVNLTGSPFGTVTYSWSFGDGVVASGAVQNHRFALTGVRTVIVTARDQADLVAVASINVTIGPAVRSQKLRFAIQAASPNVVNYIRSVRVVAPSLGLGDALFLFDEGIAGGDAVAGDGIFTNVAFVEPCTDRTVSIPIIVQDATGRETTITRTASSFETN